MNGTVVVTGVALDAPFGTTLADLWNFLETPPEPPGRVTRFSTQGCRVDTARLHWQDQATFHAAAAATCRSALREAGIDLERSGLRIGLALGSIGALREPVGDEATVASRPPVNRLGQQCFETLGLTGPLVHVVSACTSSAAALFWAREVLANGDADIMIAGGIDCVQPVDFAGFNVLRAMDPGGTRPFHAERRGIGMGEGACFLVLEREQSAQRRGVDVLARFSGAGLAADAHHPTAPNSRGLVAATRRALSAAGLTPPDIGYVNCHGTGTVANDAEELASLVAVFGRDLEQVNVGSTKGYTGHWLGSAGALEAAIAIAALNRQSVPGMPWLTDGESILTGVAAFAAGARQLDHVISNNLGFGGTNTSLVFSKYN